MAKDRFRSYQWGNATDSERQSIFINENNNTASTSIHNKVFKSLPDEIVDIHANSSFAKIKTAGEIGGGNKTPLNTHR